MHEACRHVYMRHDGPGLHAPSLTQLAHAVDRMHTFHESLSGESQLLQVKGCLDIPKA